MRLYIGEIVVNVNDLERAINFWTAALGYKLQDQFPTFAILADPRREWTRLTVQLTDRPKQGLNRLHLDLYAEDGPAEVERLKALGAKIIPWQYKPDSGFLVMADLDGNEFCVIGSNLQEYQ